MYFMKLAILIFGCPGDMHITNCTRMPHNLQRQSNIEFLHIPSCQIIRSWNQNHLCLKSEADVTALKEDFIQKKLNSYDEECFKPNCQACRDRT